SSSENIQERLENAYRELNVIYEVSSAMHTTLDLQHVLHIILTGVTSHSGLGYNRALLFLLNRRLRALECKMAIGPESGEQANQIWNYIKTSDQKLTDLIQTDKMNSAIIESSLYQRASKLVFSLDPHSKSLLTTAFYRGTPWHLTPQEIMQYFQDPLLDFFKTNELIIMPLRAKDSVNGLIVADNIYTQKPISEEDLKIFTMLSNLAGLAIENSNLYEMVVHKSQTDPVTDLWNHRFFQEKLSEEIFEAQHNKKPLSLAIIDIDNFKKLNDTHGHLYGDIILKELAHLLKQSSRDIDYVCRYGGEEFSIILIDTGKQQALEVAERLRNKVATHAFSPPPLPSEPVSISVSIGVATFPDHAEVKDDLIAQADKAMYIAKFSGKNKAYLVGETP
ncbi:MAG: sensor domain-containing diguanylate cyclase, partial [Candidatus Omnitrophica bacterium]|nr:sensor domain-containing diguanylate cyclase [Candidatus Omnitrophota bacterium]